MRLPGFFVGLFLVFQTAALPANAHLGVCLSEHRKACNEEWAIYRKASCENTLDRRLKALQEKAAAESYSKKRIMIELLQIELSLKGTC